MLNLLQAINLKELSVHMQNVRNCFLQYYIIPSASCVDKILVHLYEINSVCIVIRYIRSRGQG